MKAKSSLRKEWVESRKSLMREIKAHVTYRVGDLDSELTEAQESYNSYFQNGWNSSSRDLLIQKANQSSVILGADFHAYSQSQKSHLRVIRELLSRRPVILALESFGFEDQDYIDLFLAEKISEEKFLIKTKWEEQWGFPWSTYRIIFSYARKNNISVKGINTHSVDPDDSNSFSSRESSVVNAVKGWLKEDPEALVYVLYGELHLSPGYLPTKIKKELNIEPLVIHQNSEPLYFMLAEQGQENEVSVLSKEANNFCIMESPPWVKWQSYLMFLEEVYDLDLDEDEETIIADHTDTVAKFVEFVAKDIGLTMPWDSINDLGVYGAENDDLWFAFEEYRGGAYKEAVAYFIKIEKSFYHPESEIAFLSRLTVNHAAEVAGHYLQAKLSGRKSPLWETPDHFIANIYLETLGFFASKIVNGKRKAESLDEIRIRLSQMRKGSDSRDALLLVLDHRLTEVIRLKEDRARNKVFKPKNKGDYFVAARIMGQMLGEKLYDCFVQKKMQSSEIVELYGINVEADNFEDLYYNFVRRLNQLYGES